MGGIPLEWPPLEEFRADRSPVEVAETLLRGAVAVAAVAAVLAVVAVAAGRVAFPYPLEWMEGGLVLHVRRVLHGDPLYVEPGLSFTPFIYPPGYVYAAAAVASVTGLGFLPLRLVSAVSTLGAAVLMGWLVHRETGTVLAPLATVGLFAATYPLADTWFDLARVDMLFLLLALASLAVLRARSGVTAGVAAGVLVTLAALTKQSALLALAPVGGYVLLTDRRTGVAFGATTAGLVAAATLLLQAHSDGWFLYYVFFLPTGHELMTGRLLTFWTEDLLPVGVAALAGGWFLVAEHRYHPHRARFYALAAVGFVGAAWQGRLHSGGWLNTLVPAFAAVAVLFGLGVDRALRAAPALADRVSSASPAAVRVAILLVVLAQFVALGYAPGQHVPTAADRERGEALERQLESLEEPAFSPVFPYVAVRAGHDPVAHKMALVDVFRAPPHDARSSLRSEMRRTMAAHRYGSLALHHREHRLGPFTHGYRHDRRLEAFTPAAGVDVTPRHVFVPNASADAADARPGPG